MSSSDPPKNPDPISREIQGSTPMSFISYDTTKTQPSTFSTLFTSFMKLSTPRLLNLDELATLVPKNESCPPSVESAGAKTVNTSSAVSSSQTMATISNPLPVATTFLAALGFCLAPSSWAECSFSRAPDVSNVQSSQVNFSLPTSIVPMDLPAAKSPTLFQKTLERMLIGGFTGSIGMLFIYPTEQVKTMTQLQNKDGRPMFNGAYEAMTQTWKTKGIRGYYGGLPVLLFGNFPITAVRFSTNSLLQDLLSGGSEKKLTFPQRALCGLGAGVAEAVFAVTPIETLKIKYIEDRRLAQPQYRNLPHAVTSIFKSQGFSGLYKGVIPTILKQGSNQCVRFTVVQSLEELYTGGDSSKKTPLFVLGAFGAVAGACSVYVNTPIDVIKTRLQGANAAVYSSSIDCTKKILKKEGFRGFYKGTTPRLTRVCLDVALQFVLYNRMTEFFKSFKSN